MKKLLFLVLLSLSIPNNTLSMKMDVDQPEKVVPMEIDQQKEIDFTQRLPEELSLEILNPLILDSKDLNDALAKIYQVSKVSKDWRRLTLDPVLIKKVINKFAIENGALKEDVVIPLWNLLNSIRLANLTLKKGESQKEINIKIEEVDKKLKLTGYGFIYQIIDNSAPAFLRIDTIRHKDAVNPVAFSPDGRYLATRSYDNTAKIYDLNRKEVVDIIRHNYTILSVAFSPDSKHLATGSRDNTAKIYDLKEKKGIDTITHNGMLISVAFSTDGRYLATGSSLIFGDFGEAKIYDLKEKKGIDTITHNGTVNSVAFSPDSKYLATGSFDKTAKIYDLSTNEVVDTITHNGEVVSVAFSPDNKYLATKSFDKTAKIYDLSTNEVVDTITHNGEVVSVAFSPDSKYLATGSGLTFGDFGEAKIYDLKEKKVIDTIKYDIMIWSIAFSPDSKFLVTGSGLIFGDFGEAKIYDLKEKKVIDTITHNGTVNSVAFSPDSKYLATGSDDNTAKIYEIINDPNKKLFIKILNYLRTKDKPCPKKNIFFNYLYSKCHFTSCKQKALKEEYMFDLGY